MTARAWSVEYLDDGPDKLGRRSFFLSWIDDGGEFRPQSHPKDGEPVGLRRSQAYFADPAEYANRLVSPS